MAFFQIPFFYYYTFGPFALLLILPFITIAFILTLTLLLLICKKRHKNHTFHTIAWCVSVAVGIFSWFLENKMEQVDWMIRKSARNEIVRMIKSGEISDKSHIYYVKEYNFPPVSNGGNEILIDKNNGKHVVTFFIDRGLLDHFSAFVYAEDKKILKGMVFGNIHGIRHIEGNWYRVSY